MNHDAMLHVPREMVGHILCLFLFHPVMALVSSLMLMSLSYVFRLWRLELTTGTN
jgi:hypothetical protein